MIEELKFGASLDDAYITSFNYDRFGMFNIVIEKSLKVEQVRLSSQQLMAMGVINTEKLKQFIPK